MEDFEVLKLIGEGSFGRVFKAKYKRKGSRHDANQIVALKLIPTVHNLNIIAYYYTLHATCC